MKKIMLTLLLCSVVSMADNEQINENEVNGILTKTLTEVKSFKQEKNKEIELLRAEIALLKNKLNVSKKQQKKEIKKVTKRLELSQSKVLKYKRFETKVNKKLRENAETIKDLHFMIDHKSKVEMDEYALGRYYFNL